MGLRLHLCNGGGGSLGRMNSAGVDLLRDLLIIQRCMGIHPMQLIELPDKSIDTIMMRDYKGVCVEVCR
jgi:hypothetical protein